MEAGLGAASGQGPVTLDTVRALNEGVRLYLGKDGQGLGVKMKAQKLNLGQDKRLLNPGTISQLLTLLHLKNFPDFLRS